MKTILRLAAALLVGASALILLMVTGTPRVAFADALAALKDIRTVQMHVQNNAHLPQEGLVVQESEVIIVAPNKMRHAREGQVQIQDWEKGQTLFLHEQQKQAVLYTTTDAPAGNRPINLIHMLVNVDTKDAKPLGEKEIDGKKAMGFDIPNPTGTLTVWIDPDTRLPVRAESTFSGTPVYPARGETIYSNFVWNQEVDPALVSLDVPAGYTLQKLKPAGSVPKEQDVIDTLKQASELLGGRYPDKLDSYGLSYDIGFRMGILGDRQDEVKKLQQGQAELMRVAGQAWAFMNNSANGEDFQYAGKGKRAGTKDPILWYRPAGSQKYRVIDASMNITEVAANQLPKVKSQSLSAPPATAPAAP